MKIKKIILILISCITLVLLSLWGISEVKEANLKKLLSEMTFTSDDIYQLIDDSPSFQVVETIYDETELFIYENGSDYIVTKVIHANSDYDILIQTTSDWEEAWNYAQHWNKHAKHTNWAFGVIMVTYGDVLLQIHPVDEEFLEELNSLIMDSSKQ